METLELLASEDAALRIERAASGRAGSVEEFVRTSVEEKPSAVAVEQLRRC